MPAIQFDESRWPVLSITFTAEPTDEEFAEYLDRYSKVYIGRRERYALVLITAPGLPMTKPAQARAQANWIRDNEDVIENLCAGIAFVLPSPVQRGVLRAILWMQGLPAPHRVFQDVDEGHRWVDSLFKPPSVATPPPSSRPSR